MPVRSSELAETGLDLAGFTPWLALLCGESDGRAVNPWVSPGPDARLRLGRDAPDREASLWPVEPGRPTLSTPGLEESSLDASALRPGSGGSQLPEAADCGGSDIFQSLRQRRATFRPCS